MAFNLGTAISDVIGGIFGKPGQAKPTRPEPTRFGQQLRPRAQAVVQAQTEEETQRLQAARGDQARADRLGTEIRTRGDQTNRSLSYAAQDVQQGARQQQEAIGQMQGQVAQLPEQVRTEFDRQNARFNEQIAGATGRVEERADAAMADVYRGQSLAMQAAVQGIQGNINSQMAQIDGNPDLTPAQRESMKSQVRMQGAMAMAPAIGQTVLQFNTLAAQTNTQFSQIIGSIEQTGISERGALARAGGEAYAGASTAAAQIGTQLQGLSAQVEGQRAASQATLEGLKVQARNSQDDLLMRLLPSQNNPYPQYSNIALNDLMMERDLLYADASEGMQYYGMDIQGRMAAMTQGQGFMQTVMSGFAQGGPMGAVMGLGTSLLGGAMGGGMAF